MKPGGFFMIQCLLFMLALVLPVSMFGADAAKNQAAPAATFPKLTVANTNLVFIDTSF